MLTYNFPITNYGLQQKTPKKRKSVATLDKSFGVRESPTHI